MKTAFTLAVLGALVSAPALAQGMEQSTPGGQSYQNQEQGSVGSEQSGMSSQRQGMNEQSRQHQASNQEIRDVQQSLKQKGYNVGQIDGKMGTKTRQALEQFQRDQGLRANGRLDQQTLAALGVSGGPQQAQTPESGSSMQNQQQTPQSSQGGFGGQGSEGGSQSNQNENAPESGGAR